MNIEIVSSLFGIVASIAILVKTIKNYILLRSKYKNLQTNVLLSDYKNSLFKTKDFFYMKNGGTNPCEPVNDIEYISYIKANDIFMERIV